MKRLNAVAAVAVVALSAGLAWGQDAIALQRALDKTVELATTDMPIAQVFQKLQQQTGAKFDISADTLDLLPYGDQTRLAVELKNVTLRKALPPMLAQQALTWTVETDAIRIVPKEALYRLGRRATYDELRELGILYSTPIQPVDKAAAVLDQLRKITGDKTLRFVLPPQSDLGELADQADKKLPCIASEWLDFLCQGRAMTWFLRGDELVIIEMRAQVERQLQKTVSLKYQNANLMNVLVDLVRQSRVKLVMEPGVMEFLPPETRENFNLVMSDATVAQAFEVIAGATGLKFLRTNEGVLVEASEGLARRTTASGPAVRRRTPFFLRTTIPGPGGTTIEVYISADELPPDVVDAIQEQKIRLIEQIKESMPKTRPAATTAPAPAAPEPAKPATPADTGGVG